MTTSKPPSEYALLRSRINQDVAARLHAHARGSLVANEELAYLRRLSSQALGDNAASWAIVARLAGPLGSSTGELNAVDRAVAAVLEISALEAQGRKYGNPSTITRLPIGVAVRKASADPIARAGVERYWIRAVESSSMDEAITHILALTRLLHERRLRLDHGKLADDLIAFDNPSLRSSVRRRWITNSAVLKES